MALLLQAQEAQAKAYEAMRNVQVTMRVFCQYASYPGDEKARLDWSELASRLAPLDISFFVCSCIRVICVFVALVMACASDAVAFLNCSAHSIGGDRVLVQKPTVFHTYILQQIGSSARLQNGASNSGLPCAFFTRTGCCPFGALQCSKVHTPPQQSRFLLLKVSESSV